MKCASIKVSGSITPSTNFGGLVHVKLCFDFKWPRKWMVESDASNEWSLARYRVFKRKKKAVVGL